MAIYLDVALDDVERNALRSFDLRLDDVDAARHFRHRMFDLQPRIHFDEIETAVLIEEFEGADAAIADLPAGPDAGLRDRPDDIGRDAGRRRFLDHLLMAALHRAIAVAKPDRISVPIAEDLDFDVTRMLEEFLHVERRRSEGLAGLLARERDGIHAARRHQAPRACRARRRRPLP